MYLLLRMVVLHCYVSLPEGRPQWFTEKVLFSHCLYKSDTYSSFFRCSWLKIPLGVLILKYIIPGSCSTNSWSKANLLQCKRSNKRAVFCCCFATTGARSNNLNTQIWDEDTGATSSIAPSSLSQLSSKWQQFLPKEVRFTWLLWRRTC